MAFFKRGGYSGLDYCGELALKSQLKNSLEGSQITFSTEKTVDSVTRYFFIDNYNGQMRIVYVDNGSTYIYTFTAEGMSFGKAI